MRIIKNEKIQSFTIHESANLDPITVFMQDYAIGRGELTIICWGRAWSCYWGAMGAGYNLSLFIRRTSVQYIVNKMIQREIITNRSVEKRETEYLSEIISEVKSALDKIAEGGAA